MLSRIKFIYVFLPEQDRLKLQHHLQYLQQSDDVALCKDVFSPDQMIKELEKLTRQRESFVLQIVAHGICQGFGSDANNLVYYSDISPILRRINEATRGNLILNLMTVCCSVYQLNFFNQGQRKLFNTLIACTKGAYVKRSIEHSKLVNDAEFHNMGNVVRQINYNEDDFFDPQSPETITYAIV